MDERFQATTLLRRQKGMRGYGVYCWLAEVCNSTPKRRVKYHPEDLAWDIHEETEFVKQVAEDYELFIIEDGYLIDAYQRTKEAEERARQEAIKEHRREAAKRAAATRKRNREEREKEKEDSELKTDKPAPAPAPEQSNPISIVPVECRYTYSSEEPMPRLPDTTPIKEFAEGEFDERFTKARETWNKAFANYKRRQVNALFPSSLMLNHFLQTCSVYSDEDIELAIQEAVKDKNFTWQFKDVIKPDNVQRLLSAKEHREVQEEESWTDEQREIIEYARKKHLNWDE